MAEVSGGRLWKQEDWLLEETGSRFISRRNNHRLRAGASDQTDGWKQVVYKHCQGPDTRAWLVLSLLGHTLGACLTETRTRTRTREDHWPEEKISLVGLRVFCLLTKTFQNISCSVFISRITDKSWTEPQVFVPMSFKTFLENSTHNEKWDKNILHVGVPLLNRNYDILFIFIWIVVIVYQHLAPII